MGSPPRRRGKVRRGRRHNEPGRITPAWAGKSATYRACGLAAWDHPRVGGEKVYRPTADPNNRGSPPRRRGKEVADEGIGGIIRITPAWAEKRAGRSPMQIPRWDHPRMGGEKSMIVPHTLTRLGSPPHGRGKVRGQLQLTDPLRITPAWAGKRAGGAMKSPRNRDHPRMGGEKMRHMMKNKDSKGSPPRGRGKVNIIGSGSVSPGITPA